MRTRTLTAAGMAVVGLVWIGQGLGLLRGSSFMVDDVRWAISGAALLTGAVILGWTARRHRPEA